MKANLRNRAAVTAGMILGGMTMLSPSVAFAQSIGVGTYTGSHNNTQGSVVRTILKIDGTYNCTEGICFTATMTFPNDSQTNTATGYLSGRNFTLRRYIRSLGYVQTWNGTTTSTGVSGNWFTDPEPFNRGTFRLNR